MRKIFFITLLVFVSFLLEFLLFNLTGRLFVPNLMIILVVFTNLAFGIRYSLYTGFITGFVKDSFSIGLFGINIFSFIFCAYAATAIQGRIYQRGSRASRLFLVFIIASVNVAVHFVLNSMFYPFNFPFVLRYIYLPEVLATVVVTTPIFYFLRKCVLRFSDS